MAAKVEPGVVDITSTLNYQSETAEGTGMVLNSNGLVLTNNHVINGATSIKATLVTSGKTYTARVLGYDVTDDVALLQLQNASGLKTVSVGNSSQVTLGTPVLAIGNAGGQGGTPTVAPGIINATNRTITAGDQGSGTTENPARHAADQRADPAGRLRRPAGQRRGQGDRHGHRGEQFQLGIVQQLDHGLRGADQHGPVHRPPDRGGPRAARRSRSGCPASWACSCRRATAPARSSRPSSSRARAADSAAWAAAAAAARAASTTPRPTRSPATIAPASSGALIDNVLCGSAAASAGLSAGDVITAVNGQAVTSPGSLTTIMSKYHGGDKVSVSYVATSGGKQTASLTLGTSPAK